MRPIVSKFKVHEEYGHSKFWANVASENVLLANVPGLDRRTDLTPKIMELISTSLPSLTAKQTPLQNFLKSSGRTRTIQTDTVTWKLRTAGKILPIATEKLENSLVPGLQRSRFPIKLNTDQFLEGDILAPFIAKDLQVRVMEDGVTEGNSTVYFVQYTSSNPDSFFPPEFLEPNLQWMKMGSAYGESSSGYGSWSFNGTGWIEFESDLSDVGKKARVSNKANEMNLMLRFSPFDKNNAKVDDYPDKIISKIEAEFIKDNAWEKEMTLLYGRSAGKGIIDGTSGEYVRRGAGIEEFMEDGNIFGFPLFGGSVEMFEDYFQSLDFDVTPYNQRNRVLYTGQGGMTMWNRWLSKRFAESSVPNKYDDHVYSAKSIGDTKGLGLNQTFFVETKLFPFGSLRVEHWPILDNKEINGGILHPETGLPMASYEFYYMDHGGSGDQANIELLEKENSTVYTHVCGVWSPAGPINTKAASGAGFKSAHLGRYYDLLYADTYGVVIKDITKMAKFVPEYSVY